MKNKCFLLAVMLFCWSSSPIWAAPASSDLVGTWGTSFLSRDTSGQWTAEGGKIIFNSNGTGLMWLYRADSKGDTSAPSGSTAFTYSASPNPNGTLMLNITVGSITQTFVMVFSDSKDLILIDATQNLSLHQFGILSRVDESGGYSAGDISGNTYQGLGYELGLLGTPLDYSSLSLEVLSATVSEIEGQSRENKNGTPGPQNSFSSSYSVASDGLILMFNPKLPEQGYISKNKKVLLHFQVRGTALGTYLFIKKGDKVYSTPDLAGTFVLVGIGGNLDNGNEIRSASTGFMTCDNTGHCVMDLRIQSNGIVKWETSADDFAVAADGSFGASVGTDFPTYGAALGNGGNALIFNPSFLANPTDPQIFIGVRCSDCTNLVYPFTGHLPLILRN